MKKIRIIYDDDGKIYLKIEEPKKEKIKLNYKDFEVGENEYLTNNRIEEGIFKVDIKEKPKTYKEKYENEIMKDLLNNGVI